jgi:tRNA pseudouridine38-40 synthase
MVSDTFHPRFDATSRRYRYRLFCADTRDPLRERYAWRVWPAVNDLKPLAGIWLGTHDFSAFGSPTRTGGSTIRSVYFAEWQFRENEWIFDIQADAFLYRMVRRLVFVQVAIGQGRIQAELAIQALADKARARKKVGNQLPVNLAPACGLTLVEVLYDNLV